MKNVGMETLTELKPDGKMPQRVLFTYYQGDINAVVDEHFTRALKKVSVPTDLSTKTITTTSSSSSSSTQNTHISRQHHGNSKPRGKNRAIKAEPPALASWGQPGAEWSKGSYPCGPVGPLGSFPTAEGHPAVASQGVIMGPGGLASSVWGYHPRPSGAGFDLAPMLYPPPAGTAADAAASSSSFLSLLHMDRPAGGVVMAPKVEGAEWDSAAAFRDMVGSRMGLDSGDQAAEKGKNLYWY
ncbi:transcription cofactor vestigial-like protein 2 isoform X2 [Engraulis encrasicolus]|uniref:transcription cofactor vestigial-like protein 2 isoform X2 n=1 Tax=Engraulis encrasicolus TaxID=184585 RepID=UPI002FD075FD